MSEVFKIYKDFEGKKELLDQAIGYQNALDKINRQIRIANIFSSASAYKSYKPRFFIADEKGVVVACSL